MYHSYLVSIRDLWIDLFCGIGQDNYQDSYRIIGLGVGNTLNTNPGVLDIALPYLIPYDYFFHSSDSMNLLYFPDHTRRRESH